MNTAGERLAGTYRVIALEGCDGVGKTTVARRFAEDYGYRVVHSTHQARATDLFGHYESLLTQPGPLVLDRCFVSEAVYGHLFRGLSRLADSDLRTLAKLLRRQPGVLVHLLASPDDIVSRLHARDGSALSPEHVASISARYEAVVEDLGRVVHVHRCSSTDLLD